MNSDILCFFSWGARGRGNPVRKKKKDDIIREFWGEGTNNMPMKGRVELGGY